MRLLSFVHPFLEKNGKPQQQSLDKALVAWGVKSPPGEPEIDIKEKIKSAGLAGALAYGGTELAFWIISVPLAVVGYHQTTGEWLDLTTLEGKEKARVCVSFSYPMV